MDLELKAHLEGMESRLMSHIDTRIEALEARRRVDDEAAEIRMKEHVENVETRLLTEFWQWAKVSDIKSRNHGDNIHAIDARLAVMEERLTALELRGRIPLT
jgi:hypothetical protein